MEKTKEVRIDLKTGGHAYVKENTATTIIISMPRGHVIVDKSEIEKLIQFMPSK